MDVGKRRLESSITASALSFLDFERNGRIHGRDAVSVDVLVSKIVNWWELNERAGKGEDEGWEVLRQEAAVIDRRETTWKKPSPGVVKLNIDVGEDAKGKFRTGAIERDENGDAQSVFAALDSLDDFSDDGALVDEVKVLISGYESCSWGFVPREGNKAAHLVAKTAKSFSYPTSWWKMTKLVCLPVVECGTIPNVWLGLTRPLST
ncbi:hypothetical protein ACLB2K_055912 [Fragaria x ananassa]